MTLDPEIGVFLLSLFIGFGVGLVSGTMGVGGGIIMVPAAVLILGYGQHIGQGISLVVMIPHHARWRHNPLPDEEPWN